MPVTSDYQIIFGILEPQMIKYYDENLHSGLSYHNSFHVKDVLGAATNLAFSEGIQDEESMFILKVASLFHDSGFLEVYLGHEERSCRIMEETLQPFALSVKITEEISRLIMATKIPSRPQSHLEQIICDADLDYLGRDDFFSISNLLRAEFLAFGIVKDTTEWDIKQLRFFEQHQYFTESSKKRRQQKKDHHYSLLKTMFETGKTSL